MGVLEMRWWFTGCHALELHTGRSWRAHDDIDVGICRTDAARLRHLPAQWQVHVASAGTLRPWQGEPLVEEHHENNLWVRRDDGPWCLDVTIGDGDDDRWIFRRDPTFSLSWNDAVLHTPPGL